MKVIYPHLMITVFGVQAFSSLFAPQTINAREAFIGIVGWVIFSAFIYFGCYRLKKVSVDDRFLYISNYLKEVQVPLSEVADVTESSSSNIRPVIIHLISSTEFGRKIIFMPKEWRFGFYSTHPVVNELKEMVESYHRRGE